MSTIDTGNAVLDGLSATRLDSGTAHSKELGQEEFLSLMTAQLQNQDPLAPMENGDFIAQLAQFGTVSGIGDLQESFADLAEALTANDTLQAAALVGKTALVAGDSGALGESGGLAGAVEVPEGLGNIQLRIYSAGGALVDSIDLGTHSGGIANFEWDGELPDGERAAPGQYRVEASAASAEGGQALDVLMARRVESVALNGGSQMTLNLAGAGAVALSDVRQLGV